LRYGENPHQKRLFSDFDAMFKNYTEKNYHNNLLDAAVVINEFKVGPTFDFKTLMLAWPQETP
jgi:AICAR transformylase/IMP cyclohydrolase PurH